MSDMKIIEKIIPLRGNCRLGIGSSVFKYHYYGVVRESAFQFRFHSAYSASVLFSHFVGSTSWQGKDYR